MNKKVSKSLKSYRNFLASFFYHDFSYMADDSPDIINESRIPEDRRLIQDNVENLNNPNSNLGARPDPNTTENCDLKEESILSPGRVALRNFFRNPSGVIGLALFISIVLIVFIGSAILPFNQYYSQGNLANIPPGGKYMNVPHEMETEGTEKISIGSTFAIGLTDENDVYIWGQDNPVAKESVLNIPGDIKEKLEDKTIKDIAAGDRHIIVATEDNEIYGWGNNSFDQTQMPSIAESQIRSEGIKELGAGVQYSVVLTNENNILIWGSTLASRLDLIPSTVQGEVASFDTSAINILVAKTDGTVELLGVMGAENETAMPEEVQDGSVFVTDVALTCDSAAVLTDKGEVIAWGPSRSGNSIPEFEAPIVDINAGETTFTALDENGKIYSWGKDNYGELKSPKGEYKKVYTSYFNNYAVKENAKIDTWGLGGFRFGSDDQGRDIFTRLIHGGRISMIISLISTIFTVVLGVTIGMISGFAGGRVDNILMRMSEIISSFPFYPMLISLSALLPPGASQTERITLVMVLLGLLGWTGLARLVRAQILSERERDYITAARALGVKNSKIVTNHVLPNIMPLIIVDATLEYAGNLLSESGLSFLGFGVQEPTPSWGNMLTAAQSSYVLKFYWWRWVFPVLSIFLVSFSVNLIGDALRDAIDPRVTER